MEKGSSLLTAIRVLAFFPVLVGIPCMAQQGAPDAPETEFPKAWRFPLEFSQGFIGEGIAYAGSFTLGANYAVLPGQLRLGVLAGPAVMNGSFKGLGGVRLAWRVKTFNTAIGSWGNMQLQADHLWLTDGPALVGGGPVVEAGELVLVGLKGYWSYTADNELHPGYFQFSIGLNILKGKPDPADDDPFSNP